jgi:N-hydroxyarylamine O-acetyltransferase
MEPAMFWPEANAETSSGWRQRYLKLLGVEQAPPSLSALAALTRAQVVTVLFENVTALLRRQQHPIDPLPPLDPWALLASWEEGRGGGVCYDVTEMLGRLLEGLGYRAHPVLGAISFPGSHQALMVELEGRRWLIDAGCGAPLLEPIPLDRVTELRRAGLAYRFRPAETGDAWVQERWINEQWTHFCRYTLKPAEPVERDHAYRHHNTVGVSWVLGTVTLIRCEEERVLMVRDGVLSEYGASGKRTEPLSGPSRYRELVSQVFRLPGLPVEAGVEAWSALNGAGAPS